MAAPAIWPLWMWACSVPGCDHEPPREVEEDRARPHCGELLRTEEACVSDPAIHVDRDDFSDLEQLEEAAHATSIAHGQTVGCVEEDDPHAQGLGQHRELAADVSVADDP